MMDDQYLGVVYSVSSRELTKLHMNFDKLEEFSIEEQIKSKRIKNKIYEFIMIIELRVKHNFIDNELLKKNYIDNHNITPLDFYTFWNNHLMKYRNIYYSRLNHILTSSINMDILALVHQWTIQNS